MHATARRRSRKAAKALDAQLDQLESAQIIRRLEDPDLAYLFKHTLTQETAYGSLLLKTRHAIHRRVAETYEQLYADRLDEAAAMLAQHYAAVGDEAKTLEYAIRAADAAARVYANAEALMHYTRALEVAKRSAVTPAQLLHLYTQHGRVLELSGRYAEALANYDEMETLARTRGDRALELSALIARATIRSTPTAGYDFALGQSLLDRALALARELNDPSAECKVLWNLMLLNYFTGHLPEAVEHGERSLALARQLGEREQLAFTLNDLSRGYFSLGRAQVARAALEEARGLWRESGNLPMLADNLATSAEGHFVAGEYEQAICFAQEAYQVSQSIGNLWNQSYSRWFLGYVHLDRGQVDQGIEALEETVRLGEQAGFMIASMGARAALGWVYGELGLVERGIELTLEALGRADGLGPASKSWCLGTLAGLCLLKGEIARAAEAIKEAYRDLDLNDTNTFAPFMVVLADIALALLQQDNARAATLADNLIRQLSTLSIRPFLPDTLLLKSKALQQRGKLDEARRTLLEARAQAEALGSRRAMWMILAALGEIEMRLGHQAEAQALRAQARATVGYIAEHIHLPELQASFLSLPAVRALTRADDRFQ